LRIVSCKITLKFTVVKDTTEGNTKIMIERSKSNS